MVFTFLGLTIWEYAQYFMGFPVDNYDILMSLIGCVLTAGIIWFLGKRKTYE